MNKDSFFTLVKCTALSACKLILIITAFFSTAAYAQSSQEIDVSISVNATPYSVIAGTGELVFRLSVGIPRDQALERVTATEVVVKIEIPDGAVPAVSETEGSDICDFAEGVLTCNLGEVSNGGIHGGREFYFRVKAAEVSQVIPLKASVTANEFDPNTENNTFTRTFATTLKSRKRVRFF